MNKSFLLAFAALALFFPVASTYADDGGDAIVGLWHTAENKSVVRISRHGNEFIAEVVSLAQPNFPENDKHGMGGKPRTDRNNPKPELRNRPLVGMQFMSGLIYNGNHWSEGKVYDPESGNTYHSKLTLLKSGKLELRGYVGFSLFGRSTIWTR